jgi:hypothetical protein
VFLRIDEGQAVSKREGQFFELSGGDAAIYQQLRAGERLRYRWENWPYRTPEDREVSLMGFFSGRGLCAGLRAPVRHRRLHVAGA